MVVERRKGRGRVKDKKGRLGFKTLKGSESETGRRYQTVSIKIYRVVKIDI